MGAVSSQAFSPAARARLTALPCRGTFEAHLTVDAASAEQRQAFATLCAELGVKCVWIELARGDTPSQPMTSSHHHGTLAQVLDEVSALHARVVGAGFAIVRVKLEADAANEGVPIHDPAPAGMYFEFHAKLRLSPTTDVAALATLCTRLGTHLSRNDHEQVAGDVVRFVTMRVYNAGRSLAMERFQYALEELAAAGFVERGTKAEYTIHDDREALDRGWLP